MGEFFARIEVSPLELTYEDDPQDSPHAAVMHILDTAGIDHPAQLVAKFPDHQFSVITNSCHALR